MSNPFDKLRDGMSPERRETNEKLSKAFDELREDGKKLLEEVLAPRKLGEPSPRQWELRWALVPDGQYPHAFGGGIAMPDDPKAILNGLIQLRVNMEATVARLAEEGALGTNVDLTPGGELAKRLEATEPPKGPDMRRLRKERLQFVYAMLAGFVDEGVVTQEQFNMLVAQIQPVLGPGC